MPLDFALHNCIEKYNVLQKPTEQINEYFREHPSMYKVALLVDHLIRALAMAAFCAALPFSMPINIAICFAGSLFYRLTAETTCAYKFALPAFAGSITIPLAAIALTSIVTGVAFISISAFALAVVNLLPLTAYVSYIVLTVNYDVDHR